MKIVSQTNTDVTNTQTRKLLENKCCSAFDSLTSNTAPLVLYAFFLLSRKTFRHFKTILLKTVARKSNAIQILTIFTSIINIQIIGGRLADTFGRFYMAIPAIGKQFDSFAKCQEVLHLHTYTHTYSVPKASFSIWSIERVYFGWSFRVQ